MSQWEMSHKLTITLYQSNRSQNLGTKRKCYTNQDIPNYWFTLIKPTVPLVGLPICPNAILQAFYLVFTQYWRNIAYIIFSCLKQKSVVLPLLPSPHSLFCSLHLISHSYSYFLSFPPPSIIHLLFYPLLSLTLSSPLHPPLSLSFPLMLCRTLSSSLILSLSLSLFPLILSSSLSTFPFYSSPLTHSIFLSYSSSLNLSTSPTLIFPTSLTFLLLFFYPLPRFPLSLPHSATLHPLAIFNCCYF